MNKLKLTLTICALSISTFLVAQSTVKITQLPVENKPITKISPLKSIQITTGFAWDSYKNLDMSMLADKTVDMPEYQSRTNGMEETFSMQSVGLNTGVNLVWNQPKRSNSIITTEFRTGAAVNMMKESLIQYNDRESDTRESVMYCFIENDFKVSSDLLFRLGDQAKISAYTGIGLNASSSFNNSLIVFENHSVEEGVINDFSSSSMGNQTNFTGKNIVYGRAYIPIGVSAKLLRHFEASAELKLGRGMEQVVGGSASTFKTGEFSFGLRYNIQKNTAFSIYDFL